MSYAHADGPPVAKDGTITGKHISFELDAKQTSQIEKTHIINLTASQHAQVKAHYRNAPKTFVVVTPDYNDCSCELLYLIWNTTNTVVLPLDRDEYSDVVLAYKNNLYAYNDILMDWTKQKIIIDTKGNMYSEGKRLNRAALDSVLKEIAGKSDKYARWLWISLPPYRKTDYEGKVELAIREIEKAAKKYGVKAEIGG
jgi:hypothetical protein